MVLQNHRGNMKKRGKTRESVETDVSQVSLTGLYVISVKDMAIGVAIVFLLNLATPTVSVSIREVCWREIQAAKINLPTASLETPLTWPPESRD